MQNYQIMFENTLQVSIKETRYIPFFDKIYSFRFDKPARNLKVICHMKDDENNIVGDCFGTFVGHKGRGIERFNKGEIFNLESNGWFLPGNGFFTMIVPNKKGDTKKEM